MCPRRFLLAVCCGLAAPALGGADAITSRRVPPLPGAIRDPLVDSFRLATSSNRAGPAEIGAADGPRPWDEAGCGGWGDGPRSVVGWPMRGNVPANTYHAIALGPTWATPAWTYNPGSGGYAWRPAVAPDGTIYLNTVRFPGGGVTDGKLVALKPDGTVKWSVPLTNSTGLKVWASATPVLDEQGNIYIAWAHDIDFKHLTCISLTSAGAVRWRFEPNIELETASHQEPVLANGTLYAALDTSFYIGNPTHRASIFALNLTTGQPAWHWPSPNLDTFSDGPAVGSDGAIYHASAANSLRNAHAYLYRILPSGNLDWSRDLGLAGVNAPPALDPDNNVYLGDLAGIAYKYSPAGTPLWSYDTHSGRIYTSPAFDAGHVLIGAANAGLHVLDASTGTLLTVLGSSYYPMGKSTDQAGNVFFYCYDYQGTVFGFGRGGYQWWQFTTGAGVSVNADIVGRDGVVLVSNSQTLRAFAGFTLGDLNCDGQVDFGDIDPFVLALSDPAAYQQQYPNCNILNGDCNGDGAVDFADIDPFVAILSGG